MNVTPISKAQIAKRSAINLTSAKVRNLKVREKTYQVSDQTVRGLVVRVQPSGQSSYYANGRVGGGRSAKKIAIRIGATDQITLADARSEAKQHLAAMARGEDPTETKPGDITVGELIDLYAQRLKARQAVKRAAVVRSLRFNLKNFARQPVRDLTRQNVVGVIDAIERDMRPGAATYLRQCTTALLNWAVNDGHLHASPMAGYRREKPTRAQRAGRKVVTFTRSSEIAAFWKITGDLANTTSCDLLRFLLLTGQRATETAAMKWSGIEDGVWTIPGHMAKNGKEHRIPLGPMSLALIEAQPRQAGCDLVFPGRNGVQVAGWSTRVAPVKAALSEPGFGPHALRRTYRTGLAELNVAEPVAEMMINHTRPDLIQRYSKSELWTQRVEAQNRYESYIAEAIRR